MAFTFSVSPVQVTFENVVIRLVNNFQIWIFYFFKQNIWRHFLLFSVTRRSRDRWTPLTMINGQLWNQVNNFPTPNVYRPCTGWGGEAHEENLLGGELGEQSPWEEQQRWGRRSEKSAWILDWSNKLDGSKYSWGKSKAWRILFATLILFLSYLWMEQHYKHVYIYMCVFGNKLLFCNDISRFSC